MRYRGPVSASILSHLDAQAISEQAQRESRNREVHLPPVSVYRWWARRTLAVTGALLDAAAAHLGRVPRVMDPFAGGGVIPFAAVARGWPVVAGDLNPWAAWGLETALSLPAPEAVQANLARLHRRASQLLAAAYRTELGGQPAQVAHTMRVAVAACTGCGEVARLFPHALLTLLRRRDRGGQEAARAWLACPSGHLFLGDASGVQPCPRCARPTDPSAAYLPRRQVRCLSCGHSERLEARAGAGWRWEVVLIDRVQGGKRTISPPTPAEIRQADGPRWRPRRALGPIPAGRETRVLRRHGFRTWGALYPRRQRVVLEGLLQLAESDAERAAILGVTEMAGLLSRWDRYYLKSFEGMAGHRFNFTTLPVEPNVWGVARAGRGTLRRRMRAMEKAAAWLAAQPAADVSVSCADAADLSAEAVDLILTDPPYFDDVQYDELSWPLRAWAGLPAAPLAGQAVADPSAPDDYAATLRRIFAALRGRLGPDGRLVFSYANRAPAAWLALLGALEDTGFVGVGYAIVHSENEQDHSKRGVRAHHNDLILDLVPTGHPDASEALYRPTIQAGAVEQDFLRLAGEAVLRIGRQPWRVALQQQLAGHAFTSL